MEVTYTSEGWKLILNLAKARELIVIDGETTMPRGARAQRDEMMAILRTHIDNELALTMAPMPEIPDNDLDLASRRAWAYLAERKSRPLRHHSEAPTAYDNLKRVFDEYSNLSQTGHILHWIKDSHALPDLEPSTVDDATTATAIFKHRFLARPPVHKWLDEVRTESDKLNATDQRNFALMERLWAESAVLDEVLVGEFSRAQAASARAWEEATGKRELLRHDL